jgi:hypothetical protein
MKEENVNEWLRLSESGHVAEAEDFYYNTLFRDVIDEFCERNSKPEIRCNVLFSILGYSPEPIILTQRALNPEVHIIFTTDIKDAEASKKIRNYLGTYLTSEFKIIEIPNDSFDDIYTCLKDQMVLHPSQDYVIDITGGKKSMVATAAIFGRDYNCNVVYVDYDQYISQIRKPLPGSERLNYVYTPAIDLPEIKFFAMQKIHVNNTLAKDTFVKEPQVKQKQIPKTEFYESQLHRNNFKKAYEKVLRVFERENGYTKRVNVRYDEINGFVAFYNQNVKNKFSIGFVMDNFMLAYKDYHYNKSIKKIDNYHKKPIETKIKSDITEVFVNIIIAIDETLKKIDKGLYT